MASKARRSSAMQESLQLPCWLAPAESGRILLHLLLSQGATRCRAATSCSFPTPIAAIDTDATRAPRPLRFRQLSEGDTARQISGGLASNPTLTLLKLLVLQVSNLPGTSSLLRRNKLPGNTAIRSTSTVMGSIGVLRYPVCLIQYPCRDDHILCLPDPIPPTLCGDTTSSALQLTTATHATYQYPPGH